MREVLVRYDINCILDVGAHHGQYGRFQRNLGFRGRIVSFEPVSTNYAILDRARRFDEEWFARDFALGACDEHREINVTRISQFSSFDVPNEYAAAEFGKAVDITRLECVQSYRLDSVFEEVVNGIEKPRVFLKLDTQGSGMEVLGGARQSLEYIRGLQIELSVMPIYSGSEDYLSVLRQLHELGFTPAAFFPVVRNREYRAIEVDVICVRLER